MTITIKSHKINVFLSHLIPKKIIYCADEARKAQERNGFAKKKGRGEPVTGLDFIVPEDVPDMFEWTKFRKRSTHGNLLVEVCRIG